MPGAGGVTSYHPSSQEIGWIAFRRVTSVLPPLSLPKKQVGGGPSFRPVATLGLFKLCISQLIPVGNHFPAASELIVAEVS